MATAGKTDKNQGMSEIETIPLGLSTRIVLVWWAMPVVLAVTVLVLWFSPLIGAAGSQGVLGVAMVLFAAVTVVRAALASSSRWLAGAAGVAGVTGVVSVVVADLPMGRLQVLAGAFWVALGLGELLSRPAKHNPWVAAPPLAVVFLLAGVVTATYPVVLELDYTTLLQAVGALVTVALLIHAAWRTVVGKRRRGPVVGRWRTAGVVLEVVALVAVVCGYGILTGLISDNITNQRSIAAFYQTPVDGPAGKPGALIRSEPLHWAGLHGQAWRVLYWSQNRLDRPTVSSGTVFAPDGAGRDRRVMDLTHGTVGFGAECAYSRRDSAEGSLALDVLNSALDRDWVVAASDYADSAGTAGPQGFEAYLVQGDQARDALNAVRAARQISETGAGTTLGIVGGSQGGGIALKAANITPSYAPEFGLVGVAAAAPAADVGLTIDNLIAHNQPFSWPLGAMFVSAYTRSYPDLTLDGVVTEKGREWLNDAAHYFCDKNTGATLARGLQFAQMGPFFVKNIDSDPHWRKALQENVVTTIPAGVPAYILHGLADNVVAPQVSATTIRRFCAAGTSTKVTWIPGAGHDEVAALQRPAGAAIDWLADRFDGKTASNDCGLPMPVQPAGEK